MKTLIRQLVRLLFYVALVLVAIWWFVLEGASPQLLFSRPPEPVPFPEELLKLVSIDVDQRPLDEVLCELTVGHGIDIEIDPLVIQSYPWTKKDLVSLHVHDVPLYGVVSLLGRNVAVGQHPLIVRVKDRVVYLTTSAVWYATPSNFETRVYPLDQLLVSPTPLNEDRLTEVIRNGIEPDSWSENSNPGFTSKELGTLESVPGALVVVQTPEVHDQIQRLLNYFQQQAGGQNDFNPVNISDPCHVANAALRERLQQRVDVEFQQTPFLEIVDELANRYQLPLLLDPAWPREFNMNHIQLTFRLHDISLFNLLNLLCADMDAALNIQEGAATISSPHSRAPWRNSTRVCSVLDLQSLSRDFDIVQLFSQNHEELRIDDSFGQFLFRGSANELLKLERDLNAIRNAALPELVDSHSPDSQVQTALEERMHKTEKWGGTESVRSLATRLSKELEVNVWVDDDTLRREQFVDVEDVREWPAATASVSDYFQRDDIAKNFAVIVRDETMVLTSPQSTANATVAAYPMGHWPEVIAETYDRLTAIRHLFPDASDVSRFGMRRVDIGIRPPNRFDAGMKALSKASWPPRGVLYSWEDPAGTTVLCALDATPVLDALESIAARRIAESAAWPCGAYRFALSRDPERSPSLPAGPVTEGPPLSGMSTVSYSLSFAIESVLTLTLPSDSRGVSCSILDKTAIAIVGSDDPPRIKAILEALGDMRSVDTITSVRLDTWNQNASSDANVAFLYDVRGLLATRPGLDELGLRQLINALTTFDPNKIANVHSLPGFLIVIHDVATQRSLNNLLQYLTTNPIGQAISNDFISANPDSIRSIDDFRPEWVSQLVKELGQDDGRVCNNFRVWMLGQANVGSPEVTTALVQNLERTISEKNLRGFYLTTAALSRRDCDQNQVLTLIQQVLAQPWEPENLASLIELLPKFGNQAIPLVIGQFESNDRRVQDVSRKALLDFGAAAVPELLTWLDRTGRKEVHLITDIDPVMTKTSSTLANWEQSADPELKARAKRLRALLQDKYRLPVK